VKAITVEPKKPGSARLEDVPEPDLSQGSVLVEAVAVAVGVCGTDAEFVEGYAEAPLSGTSTNPARSLGPAIISGEWQGWWIYWVGPMIGTLAGILAFSFLAKRIEVAKLYHFESDRRRFFRTKNA